MSFATIIHTTRTAALSTGLRPAAAHCARLSHNQASNSSAPSDAALQVSNPLSTPEKQEEMRTVRDVRIISYEEFFPKTQSSASVRRTKFHFAALIGLFLNPNDRSAA
jgi:hypothetical protein